jgi:predicted nucleic-acid-binding protein
MTSDHIFADTNLFLRYLTNDVPEQAQAFEQLLLRAAKGELLFITNTLVIAEMVWTLESYYHLSKNEIQAKVLAMLNTPGLEVADGHIILQAILWYAEKNVDFIDAFNAAWMVNQGLIIACSFDRKHFNRFEGLKIWSPGEQLS